MKFSDNLSFAVRDLNRRKKRTLLTSIGIIVGTILILLMVSLGIMLKCFLIQTIDSGSSSKVITVEPFKADSNLKDIKNYTTWIKTNFNKIDNSTLSKMLSIKNTSIFLPFDTKNGQPPQYYLQKLPDSLRNYISSYFQEKPRLSLEVNNY